MKIIRFIFCSCSTCFILLSCTKTLSFPISKQEKDAKFFRRIQETISSNTYKIEINQMLPSGSTAKTLTSTYSIEIKNDSVFSHLPYFGRAYSTVYGSGNIMNFNESLTEYKIIHSKKGKTEVSFKMHNKEEHLIYRITIFPNSSASINITPNNRQQISYQGNLVISNYDFP